LRQGRSGKNQHYCEQPLKTSHNILLSLFEIFALILAFLFASGNHDDLPFRAR
jgi:hypothetical protein